MKDTNKNCRRRKVRVASKKNQKHHQQQRKATFSYEKLVRQFLLHALHHTYKLEETSKVNVPFYGRLSTLMLFNYYLQWFLMLCNLCWGEERFHVYTTTSLLCNFSILIFCIVGDFLEISTNIVHCSWEEAEDASELYSARRKMINKQRNMLQYCADWN